MNNTHEKDRDIISSSQIGQDLWVIDTLNFKRNGYFLDLGALDGTTHSNSAMLERKYGWNGICVEANPDVFPMLSSNRECMCVNSLLDSVNNEIKEFHCANELSYVENENRNMTLEQLKLLLLQKNMPYKSILMKTRTISKILEIYNAPFVIDYLSLDIEGKELDILKTFPFDDYHINTITVEHNAPHIGDKYRNEIRKVLEENDFIFVKGNDDIHNWGHGPIEDFYKNKNILVTDSDEGTTVKVTQYILPEN
jgi:FkbM family methyltransferase|tara:strand:+ start:4221 stop:4979 length:759 start_codon:yes stop_codon:yes gene_type:complete